MPSIDKDLCVAKCETLTNSVKALEIRVFDTFKKRSQINVMRYEGHKESLQSAMIILQKELDLYNKNYIELKHTVNKFTNVTNDIKYLKKKLKILTRFVIGIVVVMGIHTLTRGDYNKTIDFILKILPF